MAKTIHPVAIAIHLEDAFNRRDLTSLLPFLERRVEITHPDGSTSLGHDGARRLIEEADAMGTGRYVTWAHYVCDDGIVSGSIKVELCESASGETLDESEIVVTLDCERGKVQAIEARESNHEESSDEEPEEESGDEEPEAEFDEEAEAESSDEEAEVAS